MTTATLTATTYNNQPKSVESGAVTVTGSFNSGATSASGATTVFLCKIPSGAKITYVAENHSTGAATCPMDLGITGSISAFISAGSQGTQLIANKMAFPYSVSQSDDTAIQYQSLIGTYTPGTSTASLIVNFAVTYSMDNN